MKRIIAKWYALYAVNAVIFFLAGCAESQRYEVTEQICMLDTSKAGAMQAAEEVLGEMHFTIDKADAELGVIRTRPLPAAQFFEFWRSDNVGSFNCAEANLHSIRRIAELNVSRQGQKLCISCDVKVSRLSLPERQLGGSSRAYEMFSESSPSMQTLKLHPEQKKTMAWVDLGKDTKLATEILKRISSMLNIEHRESSIE